MGSDINSGRKEKEKEMEEKKKKDRKYNYATLMSVSQGQVATRELPPVSLADWIGNEQI